MRNSSLLIAWDTLVGVVEVVEVGVAEVVLVPLELKRGRRSCFELEQLKRMALGE